MFIAVIVLLVAGEILFGGILLQFLGLLLFGWVQYLREVLPRVTLSSEIALGAALALALATWGLHAILRWWVRKAPGESAPWRPGWSIKITTMVLLLFATSVAATGIVHQIGWLFKIKEWTYLWGMGRLADEQNNVKQVGVALLMYAGDHDDALPRDLDELVPRYSSTHRIFYARPAQGEPLERILYYPDNRGEPLEKTIVLTGAHPVNGLRVVGYRDGAARREEADEVERELQRQRRK